MASRFKVGDRVRVSDASGFSRGSAGTVTNIGFGPFDYGVMRDGASSSCGFAASELDLLVAKQPAGPVRTRKEIVPGVYGRIHVSSYVPYHMIGNVAVTLADKMGKTGQSSIHWLSPAELRAAAATFIELAAALDEVA